MTAEWFEALPEQCPPTDAAQCKGYYYRIANGNPATTEDFFSQRKLQLDKVFKGFGIDECIARAISLFSTKEEAERRLKLPKFKNASIVIVKLEPKWKIHSPLPPSVHFKVIPQIHSKVPP